MWGSGKGDRSKRAERGSRAGDRSGGAERESGAGEQSQVAEQESRVGEQGGVAERGSGAGSRAGKGPFTLVLSRAPSSAWRSGAAVRVLRRVLLEHEGRGRDSSGCRG